MPIAASSRLARSSGLTPLGVSLLPRRFLSGTWNNSISQCPKGFRPLHAQNTSRTSSTASPDYAHSAPNVTLASSPNQSRDSYSKCRGMATQRGVQRPIMIAPCPNVYCDV
jgi:hypothetical protein